MRTFIAIGLPSTFTFICVLLSWFVTPLFIIPGLLGLCDVRARYKEFTNLRVQSWINYKMVRSMRHSACQRLAMIAATPDMNATVDLYKGMGYRWWMILPDGSGSLKTNPYIKLSFYRKLIMGS